MRKIPTLFLRDPNDMRRVTREVHPNCEWVLAGEGTPTRKYDGTCVLLDEAGWWARREVKPDRSVPPSYRPVETDRLTGKTVGWEPVEQSAFAKVHAEALLDGNGTVITVWPHGTYELLGPKVNGNPERVKRHVLWAHDQADVLDEVPRDFDGLAEWLAAFAGEGIVWHHQDGRMAKLKRRDFPRNPTV